MKNFRFLLLFSLLLTVHYTSLAQKGLKVPLLPNATIQPDGSFDEKVWQKARKVKLSQHHTLYLFQNDSSLIIGVKNNGDGTRRYTDMYLNDDAFGSMNLHASMQLGERQLTANWDDSTPAWNWGNNKHWKANTVKLDNTRDKQLPFSERLQPYQGQEFQIDKVKLTSAQPRIRIEVKDFMGEAAESVFPVSSTRSDVVTWLRLKL